MNNNYYYVSDEVIVAFPDLEKSKPFKSGYDFDKKSDYFVAKINDFGLIEDYFNNKGKDLPNFFAYEIEDSNVSLFYEDIFDNDYLELKSKDIKDFDGLNQCIEETLGLSKERNIAYVIHKLCESESLNPIDFVNKYL